MELVPERTLLKWHMPIIPGLGRQNWNDCQKLETSLSCIARSGLKRAVAIIPYPIIF